MAADATTNGIRDSRLADAAERGDRQKVAALIQEKADVNGTQGEGTTALHWAAQRDDVETARLLIAAGANVKAQTEQGAITPLFMACTNGNAAMIELLVKAGADVNAPKTNGTTPLMLAAASGSVPAVKALIDHGAKVDTKETVRDQTALMFAAALGRADVVSYLAKNGASLNVLTKVTKVTRVRFDQDGNVVEDRPTAAAAKAAPKSEAEIDKAEAEAKAKADAEALKRATVAAESDLDMLARSMQLKSASYQFAKGKEKAGDVAFRAPRRVGPEFTGGMSALLYAAREGHADTVKALVEAGADVNVVAEGDKFSPMVMALVSGHLDIAKYLLEHGADPNKQSLSGMTALYATVDVQWAPKVWYPQPIIDQEKTKYLDLMEELLKKGAKPDLAIAEKPWYRSYTNDYTWIDPAGATAFWRAAQSSDVDAMKLLVKYGANPKIATTGGDTPLHAAAGIGWAGNWSQNAPRPLTDAVKYAVELGNDVNATDKLGYTALHGAAYLGDNDMVKYLASQHAKIDAKSKQGDYPADMANGPTRFGQPHPATAELLESLGSPNSHNCRSDQCVVAARSNVYTRPLSEAEEADKANLDKFANALGFKEAEYKNDAPFQFGFGGGRGRQEETPAKPAEAEKPATPPTAPAPR
jgi:ankyrin repeat protein